MKTDMTKGNPMKIILLFSIPVLMGNLFQQFYNMVDTIIVGQYLGREVAVQVADFAERVDLRRRQRRGDPLPLVLGEKGEALGSDSVCVGRSVLHAARSAYVRSEIFHSWSFPFNFQTKLKFL